MWVTRDDGKRVLGCINSWVLVVAENTDVFPSQESLRRTCPSLKLWNVLKRFCDLETAVPQGFFVGLLVNNNLHLLL